MLRVSIGRSSRGVVPPPGASGRGCRARGLHSALAADFTSGSSAAVVFSYTRTTNLSHPTADVEQGQACSSTRPFTADLSELSKLKP